MSTYVIGDVHGCHRTLTRLFDDLPFDATADRLWMVGDLVNRGPSSLAVLRWVQDLQQRLGDRMVVVLGNHDLHLLRIAAGLRKHRSKDRLLEVLAAPDRDELLSWLRQRPLLHRHNGYLLVHAGLLPEWSADQAESLARAVEAGLRRTDGGWLLNSNCSRRDERDRALHQALTVFTCIRMLTADGRLSDFTGPPSEAPDGQTAWFDVTERRSRTTTAVTGHWAALGVRVEPSYIALDSGCAWGNELTAIRLEDRALFTQPVVD